MSSSSPEKALTTVAHGGAQGLEIIEMFASARETNHWTEMTTLTRIGAWPLPPSPSRWHR